MLRTFLVLMVAAFMTFSIVGCGGGEKPAPEQEPAEESITPAESPEMEAEEMMEEEMEEGMEEVGEEMEGSGTH
jgi:hypothetical protein